MYFYATLIAGIVFLWLEVITAKGLTRQLSIAPTKQRWGLYALLALVGVWIGARISLIEYANPLNDEAGLMFFSFPVLAGASDGTKDFLGAFTIPAILINFVIGLLFPTFAANVVFKVREIKRG